MSADQYRESVNLRETAELRLLAAIVPGGETLGPVLQRAVDCWDGNRHWIEWETVQTHYVSPTEYLEAVFK